MSLCRRCMQEFYGITVVTELGHRYHEHCFKCKDCCIVLKNHGFVIEADSYYCIPDFKRRHNLTGAETDIILGTFKVVKEYTPEDAMKRLKDYGHPSEEDERPWYLQILYGLIGCCI